MQYMMVDIYGTKDVGIEVILLLSLIVIKILKTFAILVIVILYQMDINTIIKTLKNIWEEVLTLKY